MNLLTRCINCGRVLTEGGIRRLSAEFDSSLPSIPPTASLTFARCAICYAVARALPEESL